MAAGVSEDSSSSDDEELKRCQEAVWNTQALKTKDAGDNVKKSKRLVVADHEHDGNELQVTQGFQTHVAKKLGLILDSLISEKQSLVSSCVNTDNYGNHDDDEEEEGFRLFTTSVPGQKTEDPPAPKRRPIPSSSDSDGEMEARLKEAAISINDLLSTALPLSNSTAATTPNSELTEKVKKKKKKRKRPNQEDNEHADSASTIDIQNNGDHVNPEEEQTQTTVKHKKKKKKKKGSTEREVLSFPS